MEYLGDKLTVAQSHMTHWVGSVRRSLQEALNLVTTAVAHDRATGEGAGRAPFKRTSSFRHLASRSRESFRRFSTRSQQRLSSLRKRQAGSEQPDPNQLRQCFGKPAAEAQDTDTLVQEADSQYGTWSDQRHSGDSLVPESPSPESSAAPTRRQPSSSRLSSFSSQTDPASGADQQDSSRDRRSTSLDCSSTDADSADGIHAPAGTSVDFSFLDQTSVLDSSALKTRVQLSKRRRQHRAPISHALRRSSGPDDKQRLHVTEEEAADSAWMFRDSTGSELSNREESDEEDGSRSTERLPACHAGSPKRQDLEGTAAGLPTPLPKSPKSPVPAGGLSGGRVPLPADPLPCRSEEPSPQWLKELKSRKRQSQYENQV
uniref:Tankyrase 1-binding protein C-terminal domain-containing protein n=1 Tax=Varanus komodoensis TaxID=61221 RepID=A0A8D2LWR1_VARKO